MVEGTAEGQPQQQNPSEASTSNTEEERKEAVANLAKNILLHTVEKCYPDDIPQGDIFTLKPPRLNSEGIGRALNILSVIDLPEGGKIGMKILTNWENTEQEYNSAGIQIAKLTPEDLELIKTDRENAAKELRFSFTTKFVDRNTTPDHVMVTWSNNGKPPRILSSEPIGNIEPLVNKTDSALSTMEVLKKDFGHMSLLRK